MKMDHIIERRESLNCCGIVLRGRKEHCERYLSIDRITVFVLVGLVLPCGSCPVYDWDWGWIDE
jgi:hypothetical protein